MTNNPSIKGEILLDTYAIPGGRPDGDSVGCSQEVPRITTALLTMPRVILAEFNTHCALNRNAQSSRARPVRLMIDDVINNPYVPVFRANGKGMQGYEEVPQDDPVSWWLELRDDAVKTANKMVEHNVHKQYVNRLLEPWMFTQVQATGTEWANFFAQRCHEAAEPAMHDMAHKLLENYLASTPQTALKVVDPSGRELGSWHLPWVSQEEMDDNWGAFAYSTVTRHLSAKLGWSEIKAQNNYPVERWANHFWPDVSTGRSARISYKPFEAEKSDILEDIRLAVEMSSNNPGHWSPFTHPAKSLKGSAESVMGYKGFQPYRAFFDNENITRIDNARSLL